MWHYELVPIHLAASNGHLHIVELLIENGADINKGTFDWDDGHQRQIEAISQASSSIDITEHHLL